MCSQLHCNSVLWGEKFSKKNWSWKPVVTVLIVWVGTRKCKPWVQLARVSRDKCASVFTDNSFPQLLAGGRAPWHTPSIAKYTQHLSRFPQPVFCIRPNPTQSYSGISVFQIDLQCWEQGFNKVSGADHSEKSPKL